MPRLFAPILLALGVASAHAADTKKPAPPTPPPAPASAKTSAASTSPAVSTWCADLGKRLHSVDADNCLSQDFTADKERTVNQHALVWRDIPAQRKKGGKAPRALIIGGIHGDELTAVSIVFSWLKWIDEGSARNYDWRVIPVSNPDGLLVRPSTRVNANGVDLNRNFPTPDWNDDAQKYWIERTGRDPRRYPGKAAGSETETRWLQKHLEEFKPDVIISIHAPYNLLDYDGPAPQPLRFGRLTLNRLGVYPGSMGNYGGLYKNVPVVTIELPNATMMPPAREQRAMWVDMLKWMDRNIKAADDKPAAAPKTAEARKDKESKEDKAGNGGAKSAEKPAATAVDRKPTEKIDPKTDPRIDHKRLD